MNKLFVVKEPEYTSTDLTMGTGTRVYLKKDGISKVLNSKNTKLASTRRKQAIAIYTAWKTTAGIQEAKNKQVEFLQSFTYHKRGPIILTNDPTDGDKLKPIYAISSKPGRVDTAWFHANQTKLIRRASENGLNDAETDFNEFVATYPASSSPQVTEWFNRMIEETKEIFTERRTALSFDQPYNR
ncbi:hypothetical protein CMI47_23465 [Candidatus Pacearchaeota archaeon]|nr:hypothetical protein [Candidatus Pacearchaeota archaeon]